MWALLWEIKTMKIWRFTTALVLFDETIIDVLRRIKVTPTFMCNSHKSVIATWSLKIRFCIYFKGQLWKFSGDHCPLIHPNCLFEFAIKTITIILSSFLFPWIFHIESLFFSRFSSWLNRNTAQVAISLNWPSTVSYEEENFKYYFF